MNHPLWNFTEEMAKEWETVLEDICHCVEERQQYTIREIHADLVELAGKTIYSGHDLAFSLHLLLKHNMIQGRWSKAILMFEHEWVLPAAQSQVKELFTYLQTLELKETNR